MKTDGELKPLENEGELKETEGDGDPKETESEKDTNPDDDLKLDDLEEKKTEDKNGDEQGNTDNKDDFDEGMDVSKTTKPPQIKITQNQPSKIGHKEPGKIEGKGVFILCTC